MEKTLKVQKITKTYHDFKLDQVSFDVPRGSIVGLIGENGSGKTTIIKAILNLIQKQEGLVEVFGKEMKIEDDRIKEEIGVVLDGSNFHDGLKATDIDRIMKNIYKNWDRKKFYKLLEKFKIPEDKINKSYSKGMKMKLQIAVALSHNPKLLILDEATSGLDPVAREEILDLLMEFIQDEEKSILISSHITSDLDKIADYIVFIHEGKVLLNEEKEILLDTFGILKCGQEQFFNLNTEDFYRYRKNLFGYEVLVKDKSKMKKEFPDTIVDPVSIEEMMLFFIRGDAA